MMARTLSSNLSLYFPGSSASVLDISASTRICDRWSWTIRRATSPSSDASSFPEKETYTSLMLWDRQKSRNVSAAPGTASTVGVFQTQSPCTGPAASAAKTRLQNAPRIIQTTKEQAKTFVARERTSRSRLRGVWDILEGNSFATWEAILLECACEVSGFLPLREPLVALGAPPRGHPFEEAFHPDALAPH